MATKKQGFAAANKSPAKGGRPRKAIDPAKVRKLASLGLSTAEIAAVLDCSQDTIERRYRDSLKGGRERRNASLKRKQHEVAMSGNPTMLIWLGKQYLDQSDTLVVDVPEDEVDPKEKLRKFLGSKRQKQE